MIGGWVSSFYLLLPACLTIFLGIYIDVYGQRIGFRECILFSIVPNLHSSLSYSICLWLDLLDCYVAAQVLTYRPVFQ